MLKLAQEARSAHSRDRAQEAARSSHQAVGWQGAPRHRFLPSLKRRTVFRNGSYPVGRIGTDHRDVRAILVERAHGRSTIRFPTLCLKFVYDSKMGFKDLDQL